MSNLRIIESLNALFANHAIVFWHDVDSEFNVTAQALPIEGVQMIELDRTPSLQVKLQIERSSNSKWLIYSNQPEPEPSKDWLLDVRLRSKAFRADAASILLEDLGLSTLSLRSHLKARSKFLRSKDRVDRLKRFVLPTDTAQDLDLKMLAVLTRAELPELFTILQRIYGAYDVNNTVDLDFQAKIWNDICSNDLEPAFWDLVKQQFGYTDNQPSLRDLLVCILVTDFSRNLIDEAPKQLTHFVLPERSLAANASVFASRWRYDIAQFSSYNALAFAVAQELELTTLLGSLSAEQLIDCMTFEDIELRIIQDLKKRIIDVGGANMDVVRNHIVRRQDGHWANSLLASANDRTRALAACYNALTAAIDFFVLKSLHASGLSFTNASVAFVQYRDELFKFDQLYRHFHTAADAVEPTGWAVLHELRDKIEGAYSGWFIPQLSSAWAKIVEGPQGLLNNWALTQVTPQQDFYKLKVEPLFEGPVKRVFVVISDALRYEVAHELVQNTNSKNRFKASIEGMLGVLPSYTALGMAALLPHTSLAYKVGGTVEVQVDGQTVSTLDQRHDYLKTFGGVAIKAEDLMSLGRERGRESVRDHRLIYVYHDRIDMIGDKQASETKTFEAADQTIQELSSLLSFIIQTLNGSTVLLTADHGFMYQESALESADKSALDEKPPGTLIAKKRYLIGKNLGATTKVWSGNTALTAGTTPEGSLDFWVPKGASRFHFVGGARFVHGSAMPQEVVVPLVTVRVSEAENAKTRSVSISLLGSTNKVVTNTQRFEFIQTDAVTARVLARTVVISLRDGEALISDEQTLTFDSTSQLHDERKRSAFLTVRSGNYEPHKRYDLVMRDAATRVEVLRQPFTIDLAFGNDF
jgi:uncharacterized protein (TIGR02687 family)